MFRKRIASGTLGIISAVASTVVGMIWPTLDAAYGVPILWGCAALAALAVMLWIWPEKPPSTELEAARAYEIERAKQRAIDDAERRRKNSAWLAGLMGTNFETFNERREREREIARSRAIAEASRPQQPNWTPLHKVLRYLVYDTEWAAARATPSSKAEFDQIVGDEILEQMARGEIKARGKPGWDDAAKVQRTTEPIPADYWTKAFLSAHGLIVLADDRGDAVGRANEGCYRYVILDQNDAERTWRPRTDRNSVTRLSQFCEPLRHQIEEERANEQARTQPPV